MSTSPFGYFGTGLKYAISVLLREGCEVVLWRGSDKYTFFVSRRDFREKSFDFVRMKKETYSLTDRIFLRPQYSKLPFTTELGKNWKLWQAFRELETNTRDEGGDTSLISFSPAKHVRPDHTFFLVYGDRFADEFLDMNRHFLEGGKIVREDEAVQVIDKPSKYLYYRGVRIVDLEEESEFTYNILSHVELTEDRTAKYLYAVEQLIAGYIVESEDEDFVSRVVHTSRWESSGLSYAYAYTAPSPTFVRHSPSARNPTVSGYLKRMEPSVATSTTVQIVIPKPEVTEDELWRICEIVNSELGLTVESAKNLTTDEEILYPEGV
jgi:hypothetical protein